MSENNLLDEKFLQAIKAYVDEQYTDEEQPCAVITAGTIFGSVLGTLKIPGKPTATGAATLPKSDMWGKLFKLSETTFSETLLRLMEKRGIKPAELYRKTGLTKSHFSKIKLHRDYQPSKETALALAIALRLTLEETADFLKRAGYSISHSQKRDIVVEYFIKEGIYDNDKVNISLYKLGLPPLTNRRQTTDE